MIASTASEILCNVSVAVKFHYLVNGKAHCHTYRNRKEATTEEHLFGDSHRKRNKEGGGGGGCGWCLDPRQWKHIRQSIGIEAPKLLM